MLQQHQGSTGFLYPCYLSKKHGHMDNLKYIKSVCSLTGKQ